MDIRKIKRQHNIQQWKKIIMDRCNSGLMVDEYCKQNDISRHAYFYWLRIIREEEIQSELMLPENQPLETMDQNKFIEIPVPTKLADTIQPVHKLDLDSSEQSLMLSVNGIDIKINENTPTALLARTLEVIRNAQ